MPVVVDSVNQNPRSIELLKNELRLHPHHINILQELKQVDFQRREQLCNLLGFFFYKMLGIRRTFPVYGGVHRRTVRIL